MQTNPICDACIQQPPYMCMECNDVDEPLPPPTVFEPHDGRMSVVGTVAADFWFV